MNGKAVRRLVGLLLLLALIPTLTASAANWSQPVNVSGWVEYTDDFWLWISQDGTRAAFWVQRQNSFQEGALWASVRQPGQDWTTPSNLSGWIDPNHLGEEYLSSGLTPDGTAWALWVDQDSSQVGDNWQVKAAWRPTNGSWKTGVLSEWYESAIRSSQLAIGPDGDLAAVWVACASLSNIWDPPCHVRIRRRAAGAGSWQSTEQVDTALPPAGINESQVRMGPDELTVVVWTEANAADPTHFQWWVMARAYRPAGGWDGTVKEISNGWVTASGVWLAQSVMDPAGTLTTAWKARDVSGSDSIVSATRAGSTNSWSLATEISLKFAPDIRLPRLAVGRNGTVAAVWEWEMLSGDDALYAVVRDPGSSWGSQTRVHGPVDSLQLSDVEIWPDGTSAVLWKQEDQSKPSGGNASLRWSARPAQGQWGDQGMAGRIGELGGEINGAGLGLSSSGRAAAVWSQYDGSRPANQQWSTLASVRPAGGEWTAPDSLAEGYALTGACAAGVTAAPQEDMIGALWQMNKPANYDFAMFYSQLGEPALFLPLVIKNSS